MHPVGNIYHVPEFRGHQAFYKRPRRDKSGDPGIGHDIVPDIRNDRVEHLAGISAVFLSEKPVGTAVGICKSEIVKVCVFRYKPRVFELRIAALFIDEALGSGVHFRVGAEGRVAAPDKPHRHFRSERS